MLKSEQETSAPLPTKNLGSAPVGPVDIDLKEMAASSTGIRVGAWSKREIARAGDKQVAREGNDDRLGMGPGGGGVVLPYMGSV